MTKFTEIATLHPRNPAIPERFWVFNAPRPLCGSLDLEDCRGTVWTGQFLEGIHYAAVDPADPEASRWLEENRRLGAVLVRYVTNEEVCDWAESACKWQEIEFTDLSAKEVWQMYFQENGRREVEIGEEKAE